MVIEWYDDGRSLDHAISDAIELYADERRDAWSDFTMQRQLADRVARLLVGKAQRPHPENESSDSNLVTRELARRLAEFALDEGPIRERMQLQFAWELLPKTEAMANRAVHLASEVLSRRPNQATVRYIGRLSRCYIMGFLPETVILCRAVLENALVDLFKAHGTPLPATESGKSSLKTQIDATRRFGFLSDEAVDDAHQVRMRGNTAVHNDPDAVAEVESTVMMTYRVLSEIYRG